MVLIDPQILDVRADFPILRTTIDGLPVTYMDSAATTLKPQAVIDAITHYYAEVSANIHRGRHRLSEDASTAYEEARAAVAEVIGASTSEVVFVRNTTEALNVVCDGLRLTPEDLVVVGYDAHHSNMLPWRRRGRVEYLRILASGGPDLEHFEQLLSGGPRVVALNHCSNLTGVIAPVAQMAAMARAAGAIVVLDMAQSLPHRRVSVRDLAVDFAAFSGHKMLGPTGIGVLYGRHDRLSQIDAAHLGGGTVDWVDDERFVVRELPHRLEGGTPHIAGAYGLHAAIRYLDRLGWDNVAAHGEGLAELMAAMAAERPYLRPVVEHDGGHERTSILSFTIRGHANLDETARALSDAYGVMCRSGHMCAQPFVDARAGHQVLRASAYVYSTADDVQRLFAALDDLCS